MLDPRDFMNLLHVGPASRHSLVVPIRAKPAGAANDLEADHVNGYVFPRHPIVPDSQLCDCDQWQLPNVNHSSWGFGQIIYGNPATHIPRRAAKNPNNGTRNLTAVPAIMGYPNKAEWYNSRRRLHLDPASVSCMECKIDAYNAARETANHYWWRPLCGPCHKKAKREYPAGYNSCTCEDMMVERTCVPCADRVLLIWEARPVPPWPGREVKRTRTVGTRWRLRERRDDADPGNSAANMRKWETCPCGDFIDPVKAPKPYKPFLRAKHRPFGPTFWTAKALTLIPSFIILTPL